MFGAVLEPGGRGEEVTARPPTGNALATLHVLGGETVANAVEIECAGCGSVYRMLTRASDVTVLFRCVHCKEFSLYHLGYVVALNNQIMADGPDEVRREHLRQRMEDSVLDALADVRTRLENIINVNAEVDFAKRIYPPDLKFDRPDDSTGAAEPVDRRTPRKPARPSPLDEFSEFKRREAITDREVADFRDSLDDPRFWDRLDSSD